MISKPVRLVIWGLSSVVVLGTLLCAQPAAPAKGCSNATVHGRYGFAINGTINGNPITTVGQMATNGNGTIAGMETVSNNGAISNDLPILGEYTINPDCTGTAAITPQGGTKSTYNLTVISGGTEIDLVETDNGTVESGNAKAKGPKACSSSALKGAYGLQGSGTEVGFGPLVFGGQIVFHGDGTLDGTETISVNGGIASGLKITGAYKVDKRCFGGAVIFVNNQGPVHLNLAAVNGERGVYLIQTDAGSLVSGFSQQ